MQEERRMILEMLADGKITAAEAAELLRALAGPEPGSAGPAPPGIAADRTGSGSPEGAARDDEEEFGRRRAGAEAGGRSILEDFLSRLDIDWGNLGISFGGDTYRFEEELRGEFAGDGPVSLELEARNGRVEIYGWDEPGWRAVMRKRVRAADEAKARQRAAEIARFQSGPDRLFFEEQQSGWTNSGVSVEIHVPRALVYSVRARSSNGRVVLEGLVCRDLVGHTANGKVSARGIRSRTVELSTANGGMAFEGSAAQLECGTTNGQITFCPTPLEDMRCRLHTSNGSIRVRLPEATEVGYRIEARTGHGGLEVSLPDFLVQSEEKQFGRRRLTGQSQGYDQRPVKVDLSARTSNGGIRVTEGPPLAAPAEPGGGSGGGGGRG